jgi:hypothetical protein
MASFSFSIRFRSSARLSLNLLQRRRVGMVGAASWIGANLDHLSALPAVHDDGLSHLVAWLLVPRGVWRLRRSAGFLISNQTY